MNSAGVAFDMKYAGKLPGVFQRFHSRTQLCGTAVGLAFVECSVQRHGGQLGVGGTVGESDSAALAEPVSRMESRPQCP